MRRCVSPVSSEQPKSTSIVRTTSISFRGNKMNNNFPQHFYHSKHAAFLLKKTNWKSFSHMNQLYDSSLNWISLLTMNDFFLCHTVSCISCISTVLSGTTSWIPASLISLRCSPSYARHLPNQVDVNLVIISSVNCWSHFFCKAVLDSQTLSFQQVLDL